MTIEKLTNEQREFLIYEPTGMGPDALRIIDAQAAEIERLRALRQPGKSVFPEVVALRERAEAAEAGLAEATALQHDWNDVLREHRDLLKRWRDAVRIGHQDIWSDTVALLAVDFSEVLAVPGYASCRRLANANQPKESK